MQGHPEVIGYFNTLLTDELVARDQYFIRSHMYGDWDFSKFRERLDHKMEGETQHADALLRRILLLEGTPRMRPDDIHPGTTVSEMLKADLKLGRHVRAALVEGIVPCKQHRDSVGRDTLKAQLAGTEEDHTYWLEQQLGLIARMGLENYLQSQI